MTFLSYFVSWAAILWDIMFSPRRVQECAIFHAVKLAEISSLERDRESSNVRKSEYKFTFEKGSEKWGSQGRYRKVEKEREREKKRRIHSPEEANNNKKKWKWATEHLREMSEESFSLSRRPACYLARSSLTLRAARKNTVRGLFSRGAAVMSSSRWIRIP